MTSEDAAGALRARLDRFLASGDPAEIGSAETAISTDAVLASVDWGALEHSDQQAALCWERVLLIVAVHWHRSRGLSGRPQAAELKSAADLLMAAHSVSPGGISEALRLQFQAVYRAPEGSVSVSRVWNDLGLRLIEFSERHGSSAGASGAASALKRAVDAAPPEDPHRATYLSNLGAAHSCLFELTGDDESLEGAIAAYREAIRLGAPRQDQPDERAAFLANLGASLSLRFERSGSDDDLAAALDAQREALRVTPEDHDDRPMYLSNLGGSLISLFQRTGDLAALEQAIEALRSAVRGHAHGDEAAEGLTNLGRALLRYAEQTADTDALNSAVDAFTAALRAVPEDHPAQPGRLNNLAAVCLRMYDVTGDAAALEVAAEALGEALRFPQRHRADQLSNLGVVRQRQFDHGGEPASIIAAVAAYQEALAGTSPEDPARPGCMANLGGALLRRYQALGELTDLDRAVGLLAEAIAAVPSDFPDLCRFWANQGDVLSARFAARQQAADLELALAAYQSAAAVASAPALARARAALSRGRLAASVDVRDDAALGGYSAAIRLVSLAAWPGLGRADQERLLREFAGLASDAAACAIARGQAGYAVELLEQGRGVLLGQAMDSRTSDSTLAERHPDLARRLAALHRTLDRPAASLTESGDRAGVMRASDPGERAVRFGSLARQRTELLSRIRALPDFAGFLLPPDITALQAVAARHPVVMVNISQHRCDALAVSGAGVKVIPLPGVTLERVADAASAHLTFVEAARSFPALTRRQRGSAIRLLRETLGWLWEAIAAPVLDELGYDHRDSGFPELWWCPTGMLGLLPLHAAQRYDPVRLADTGVPDRVIFSYTPTIRALIHNQPGTGAEPRRPAQQRAKLLAIAMPRTPGLPPLRNADEEVDAIAGELPRAPMVMRAGDATVDAVRLALTSHQWLHYVGHSSQYLGNPSQASLFLHDGRLTMLAVSRLRLGQAEFAFLSSCESGLGGTTMPDEAVNLASALQIAGYRHVISTLWSIGDRLAVDVARQVYAELSAPGPDGSPGPATALHSTLRRIRAEDPSLSWAAYSHAGG